MRLFLHRLRHIWQTGLVQRIREGQAVTTALAGRLPRTGSSAGNSSHVSTFSRRWVGAPSFRRHS